MTTPDRTPLCRTPTTDSERRTTAARPPVSGRPCRPHHLNIANAQASINQVTSALFELVRSLTSTAPPVTTTPATTTATTRRHPAQRPRLFRRASRADSSRTPAPALSNSRRSHWRCSLLASVWSSWLAGERPDFSLGAGCTASPRRQSRRHERYVLQRLSRVLRPVEQG